MREYRRVQSAPQPLTGRGVVIRRTPDGWQVGDDPAVIEPDLTSAMVLADLLGDHSPPLGRPTKAAAADEAGRLRVAVRQLEHALAARVVIEQAIGVLAERRGCTPTEAFDGLRRAARSRSRRVQDLASDVVASVSDASVSLPAELPPRR